jgi:hypothetical protein
MKMTIYKNAAKLLFGALLITLISLWTYYPTTANFFVWDDHHYLYKQLYWFSEFDGESIAWMFFSLHGGWIPLIWLSWAIDFQIYGGLDPWGYHLTNNVLHAANGILFFILVLVVFGLNKPRSGGLISQANNHALIAAIFATLLFTLHPQHVESVAWVSERKDLLFQFFLLISTLFYVKYVISPDDAKRRWIYGTLILFSMALMSKPMAVTYPVILLLMDVYPLRRTRFAPPIITSIKQQPLGRLLKEKLPFFFLSLLLILVTIQAQQAAMGNTNLPFSLKVLNAFNSTIFYLKKLFLPTEFSAMYPFVVDTVENLSLEAFLPMIGTMVVLGAAVFAWTKGHRSWLIVLLIYIVSLSPVLGLIQVGQQGAADRYAYFPLLPVYLLIAGVMLGSLTRLNKSGRFILVLVMCFIALLLAQKTREQIEVWKTDETLWTHTVALYPDNPYARLNLGVTFYNYSQYENAYQQFEKVNSLIPADVITLSWLGKTALRSGKYKEAILYQEQLVESSKAASKIRVDQFCVDYNIGWAYANLGKYQESKQSFSRVSEQSLLFDRAAVWLNWLNKVQQPGVQLQVDGDLPQICEGLI